MTLQNLARMAESHVESNDQRTEGMQWAVVGGAVRDALRGITAEDLDFVVLGETKDSMLERGFRLIDSENNDTFPVFLDSEREEFALPRAEHSTGTGHKEFTVEVGVSLESDLRRRDLTVNAMALLDGELLDPFDGREDLEDGVIRHVSEAFTEDPLRILRAARFAARLDAEIAEETENLMDSAAPMMHDLPGERIRMELEKAFAQSESPRRFFDTLPESALTVAFPEVAALKGVPAGPEPHHREGDAFEHTMLVIEEMNELRENDTLALLMALVHDFGKAETPEEEWPNHFGHAKAGLTPIGRMNQHLRFSTNQFRAMKNAARLHMKMNQITEMRDATIFDMFNSCHESERLIALAQADARGRIPPSEFAVEEAEDALRRFTQACEEITGQTLIDRGRDPEAMGGEKFGKHMRDARIAKMKRL